MTSWYCPLPFKHAYIDSTGVAVCCQTPRQPVPLETWPENPYLKKIQSQLLQGQVPLECQNCVQQEKTQGRSLRTDAIKDYNNQRFVETQIDFVDYRSNNICNFKCRTCDPVFSHGIANEVKNSDTLQQFFKPINTKTVHVTEENANWVANNIDTIKRLMITGGEPTVMPEVKKMVEKIVYDQLDVDLLITTNASFVDDFWCEATRLYKKLHWTVSIDAVGQAAEIVRYGTSWTVVERNVRWLAQHAASLDVNTVVSNLNAMQLRPLLEFVIELQKESRYPRGLHGSDGCRHQFHICQRPYYLAADNWPNDLKPRVLEHLQQCLNLELSCEQRNMVSGLISNIQNTHFDSKLWDRAHTYNIEFDKIRNQNYNSLYM